MERKERFQRSPMGPDSPRKQGPPQSLSRSRLQQAGLGQAAFLCCSSVDMKLAWLSLRTAGLLLLLPLQPPS